MDLSYEFEGKCYTGHLALPTEPVNAPGILVFHGGSGLGEQARSRADMLAGMGYAAYAPDLFGGRVEGLERAEAVCSSFLGDWERLCRQCEAALVAFGKQAGVDARRIAAIGFCFGGQVALEFARSGVDLRAIIGFHSRLVSRHPERSRAIKGKVLVCLGDSDRFVSRDAREDFLAGMTFGGVDCQMLLFSGVQHSFTDPYAEASGVPGLKYDPRADRRAWGAMQVLLEEVFSDISGP